MAKLTVEVQRIEKVIEHPNADRLDLATVLGYTVVVGRGQYKVGDLAVYFPVDSILPINLQEIIFAGSKMSLSKSRVRAARIRGAVSEGLLVELSKIESYEQAKGGSLWLPTTYTEGMNLTDRLDVKKFEPPVKGSPQSGMQTAPKRYHHPDFKKYTDIQHGKRNIEAIQSYDGPLMLTEKVHGTNFRCGWVPFKPRTRWHKLLKVLSDWTVWNFVPEFEFVYGSHNVQLQDGNPKAGDPAHENVYLRAVKKYDLPNVIKYGEVWYFEIFGDGIQKNYSYGLKDGEFSLVVIDIKTLDSKGEAWEFMPWHWARRLARVRKMQPAPSLLMINDKHFALSHTLMHINQPNGKARCSQIDGVTPIEGGVLRPLFEEVKTYAGRYIFKFISDEYLLNKSNSDFH